MATVIIRDMFEASRSLVAGAKIIIGSEGIGDRGRVSHPTLPVIVCCALAIEIGLKTLLTVEGHAFPKKGGGHSLKALLDAVSAQTQRELLRFQKQFTGHTPSDARRKLYREDMTFVAWRYAYEHSRLSTRPAFLHDFAVALSQFLQQRQTSSPDALSGPGSNRRLNGPRRKRRAP